MLTSECLRMDYGSCGAELLLGLNSSLVSPLALQYWENMFWLHTKRKFQNLSHSGPTPTSRHLVLECLAESKSWTDRPTPFSSPPFLSIPGPTGRCSGLLEQVSEQCLKYRPKCVCQRRRLPNKHF